jgi:hypothetical protein
MSRIVILIASLALAGCAATYVAPPVPNQSAAVAITKPKPEILAAARRALVAAGYQITSFDDAAGIISTAPRDQHLTPIEANCGTTMGLDYLKDNRTDTRVAYGVIVSDGHLQVRANIEGQYKPGAVDQNITLTCVSLGVLDGDMVRQIESNL